MIVTRLKALTDLQKLWLLIGLAGLLRMWFAQTGLGIDEIYTVATSRHFLLSTYDHPPMAWWLAGGMGYLFRIATPFVVRVPFIILSGIATWQLYRLTQLLYSSEAGLFAALAFACAPELGITSGTWVLPDGPLLVAELAGAICLAHLLLKEAPNPWLWLAAGFWGGVALLSKYHGIFLFLGALAFIITTPPKRRILREPWIYVGALVGFVICSPVLIWNIQHHFASLAFQSGRLGVFRLHYFKPLLTVLGQALYLTPWIWLALMVASFRTLRIHDQRGWLLVCLAVPQILLFTVGAIGASAPVLFHWAMPGYLYLFPLLGDWLAQKHQAKPALIERAAVASALFSALLIAGVMGLWYFPAALGLPKDPLIDMRAINGVQSYLAAQKGLPQTYTLAPTSWHLTAQFDYALDGHPIVTCFCEDAREYGILAPLHAKLGTDFIVVTEAKHAATYAQILPKLFAGVRPLPALNIDLHDGHEAQFAAFDARGLLHVP